MTQLSSLHSTTGARPAGPEAPLPILTHGSVPAEYMAATQDWALFDRGQLGTVEIVGEDASGFLTRILSSDVRALSPGQGQRGMLLSPKGKVLHLFDLARTETGFCLTTPPGGAAALIQGLDGYLFGEALQLEDKTKEHMHLDLIGPKAGAGLIALSSEALPDVPHSHIAWTIAGHTWTLTYLAIAGTPGYRLSGPAAGAEAIWQALVEAGAQPAGLVAFDSVRAETASALWGMDVDDTVYPQEARLEDAFSLTKGCYIGQEVVAKIDTYGGMNKRLMLLAVSDDDPVAQGTRLLRQTEAGGDFRDLGVVTTWAYSFALDKGVVLAYVKRKHQEVGTIFRLGDTGREATLVELPELH